MRSAWKRLYAWAYGMSNRLRWSLWAILALAAATLQSTVPSPWSWCAVAPLVVVGVVLFDADARRQRDETKDRKELGRGDY